MPLCREISNDNGGELGVVVNELSSNIKYVNGINSNKQVTSYGGQIVDMTGDWDWKTPDDKIISPSYDDFFKACAKNLNLDWRLCAAMSFVESSFKIGAESYKGAAGLWGILFWPTGYSKTDAKDPKRSTEAYQILMAEKLNMAAKANTRNDQIALAMQSYHDGSIGKGSKTWGERKINYSTQRTGEAYEYVPKILKKYREYCR